MEELTIIIPFLNEGEEVARTVENIRETLGTDRPIVLVNDASTDGFDYGSVARKYGARMVHHERRRGVAASRDEAIAGVETPYFLLLDGHMRFNRKGWDELLLRHMKTDERCIWCGRTRPLVRQEDGTVQWQTVETYGAYIRLADDAWKIAWNYVDPDPQSDVMEIPCVLGACYAASKAYWQRLGGLAGLDQYGLDEQYISLKAWMEGGSCKLIKTLEAGHFYRKTFPYELVNSPVMYNQMLLTELLLPEPERTYMNDRILAQHTMESYMFMAERLNRIDGVLERHRAMLKGIFTRSYAEVAGLNRRMQELNIKA